MSAAFSPTNVTEKIQSLLRERQAHADAVSKIDQTLQRISDVLEPGRGAVRTGVRLARARAAFAKPSMRVKARRSKYALSGQQSILNFVQKKGSPTTREIKRHWLSEGRKGRPDNSLSLMVKAGKLERQPLDGKLGSRYVLA